MEQLQECVDRLVSAGIQSYIGLLCCGEQKRSKSLLHDILQVSGLSNGGPSAKVGDGTRGVSYMLMYFTLRGVLASLLVLRATAYWKKVPDLEQLQMCSRRLADALEEQAGLDQSALGAGAAELPGDHRCDCGLNGYSGASDCAPRAPRRDAFAVS